MSLGSKIKIEKNARTQIIKGIHIVTSFKGRVRQKNLIKVWPFAKLWGGGVCDQKPNYFIEEEKRFFQESFRTIPRGPRISINQSILNDIPVC